MSDNVNQPALKAASVGVAWLWGVTWGELASILAAIYTSLLLIEWLWKKVVKPILVRTGRIKGKGEFLDSTVKGDL